MRREGRNMKHTSIDIMLENGKISTVVSDEIQNTGITCQGILEAIQRLTGNHAETAEILSAMQMQNLQESDPEAYEELIERIESARRDE